MDEREELARAVCEHVLGRLWQPGTQQEENCLEAANALIDAGWSRHRGLTIPEGMTEIGVVADAGGGHVDVLVRRDLPRYPRMRSAVFVADALESQVETPAEGT